MTKKFFKVIGNILLAFLIFIVACGVLLFFRGKNTGQVPFVMNLTPMIVLSGSMQPTINTGDLIISKRISAAEVGVGDIITYKDKRNDLITHRIASTLEENGRVLFVTKGDANNVEDEKPVTPEQLVGVEVFNIPYGGYASNFIRSKVGFVLLLILPFSMLIGSLIKPILMEEK